MPGIRLDVQRRHLSVGDLDALGIAALIQFALHCQAGFGGRRGDQIDHGDTADKRLCAPVLRDVAKHAVLNLVPLRGPGRIMTDLEAQPGAIPWFGGVPVDPVYVPNADRHALQRLTRQRERLEDEVSTIKRRLIDRVRWACPPSRLFCQIFVLIWHWPSCTTCSIP
jgi:hypothetical protein